MNDIRLIIDPPASGAWNMAVDEALLETAAATGQATLRFYQWNEPTLSLGYFQSAGDREQHPASLDCPLVRRASGGGAILHDRELTYSIAIPQQVRQFAAAGELYDLCHESLIAVLAQLGVPARLYRTSARCEADASTAERPPFLCFQRRTCSDIVHGEAKIVGSAQRRRRGAILQHGSILLGQSDFAPELPGLGELTSRVIEASELARCWIPFLAGRLSVSLHEGGLSAEEIRRAEALAQGRFAAAEYVERR
jgi:lipoate-protein ligase A